MKKMVKIVMYTIVITFIVIGLTYSFMIFETTGKINQNVYIANTDVSGMTKQKAYARIKKLLIEKQSNLVVLKAGDYQKSIRLNGTIDDTNLLTQIDKAYDHGKHGDIIGNLLAWINIQNDKVNYPLDMKFNEVQINSILKNVKNDFINGDKSDIINRINGDNDEWPKTNLVEEVFTQGGHLFDGSTVRIRISVDTFGTKNNIKRYLKNEITEDEIEIVVIKY